MTKQEQLDELDEVWSSLICAQTFARRVAHEDTQLAIAAALERLDADIKAVDAEPEP